MRARDLIKPLAMSTLFREGAVRPIVRGPARGLRYRIYADYGLAPLYGGWEPDLQRLMTQLVSEGHVVYDVGANFGIHTLLLSRLVGADGRVYAFEPVPEIADELEGNLRLNDVRNVTVIRQALSDTQGTARFDRGHHAGAGHLSAASGDLEVEVTTLDDFAEEHRPPTLVKVDAEGAESRVLRGGSRVLSSQRPAMLVETHSLGEEDAVGTMLLAHGYVLSRPEGGPPVHAGDPWPDGAAPWGYVVAASA